MRALEFITGHMIYNLAYTLMLQTKTPLTIKIEIEETFRI